MHNKAHTYLHTDGHTYPNARTRAVVHMHVNVVDVLCGLHLSYVNSFHTCAAVFNTHTVIHICAQALFYTHTHTHCLLSLYYVLNALPVYTHTHKAYVTRMSVFSVAFGHTQACGTQVCAKTHTRTRPNTVAHADTSTVVHVAVYTHTLLPSRYITLLEADPQPKISLHV